MGIFRICDSLRGVHGLFSPLGTIRVGEYYLDRLHDEPGIVITETEKRSGRHHVFGLRDMLAADPAEILKEAKIEPDSVKFNWELYHSSHPAFIIRRISSVLRPPETITFELKDSILRAEGEASHQWIIESEKLSEAIPGILGFRSDNVIALELKQIEAIRGKIENTLFFFERVSVTVKPEQKEALDELVKDIKNIYDLAQIFDKPVRIEIIGHTDSVGSDERNLEISKERADELFSILVSKGFDAEMFTSKGVGAGEPLKEELSEADREFNRCVSFRVIIDTEESRTDESEDVSSDEKNGVSEADSDSSDETNRVSESEPDSSPEENRGSEAGPAPEKNAGKEETHLPPNWG